MDRARVWGLAFVLLLLAAPGRGELASDSDDGDPMNPPARLELRLGNGDETPEPGERPKVAPAKPLTEREVERVLSRMTALTPLADDEKDFALREASLPPPRTGATIQETFPPQQTNLAPETTPAGPLTVARRAPEGEIPIASQLSVTFSQPMVAVTSQDDLAGQAMPVRLEPQPPGRWRWVGTKTLLFEATGRFPMATQYRVTIPAGTRSAVGGSLASEVRWTFATPAPALELRHPASIQTVRQPLLFASFDQRIDPAEVLASIQLRPSGIALRLATPDEVKANDPVSRLVAHTTEGRWLAFIPQSPLPANASVTVLLAPGVPSSEGDRKTTKAQSWTFRTFGALEVVSRRCGYGEYEQGECPPGAPWHVELSNPLDAKTFRRDLVSVTPDLPASRIAVNGSDLTVQGRSKGRTTYRVKIAGALRDEFGQTLGKDRTLEFTVGSAAPVMLSREGLVVLDPGAGPKFSVFTTNHGALAVRAYAVTPQDWDAFSTFVQRTWSDPAAKPPWRSIFEETVQVRSAPDELTETRIDLSKGLQNGVGQIVLLVTPTNPQPLRGDRRPRVAWVQATQIGLDAFADETRLVAWTTALSDGKPLADCEVALDSDPSARSGADGVATLEIDRRGSGLLVARCGGDVAILPNNIYSREIGDRRVWYVFDDRQLYRPGEQVKLKGWIRQVDAGPTGDVGPLRSAPRALGYVVQDSQGNEIAKGKSDLNAFGGFETSVTLPATVNLGLANVFFDLASAAEHVHSFQVEEFRRPEFEVTATASAGPHVVGAHVDVDMSAAYYAGGGLPDAEVIWTVRQARGTYTPPNRDDFIFGIWRPWWEWWPPVQEEAPRIDALQARTDASGKHVLRIDLLGIEPPQPMNVSAEASVSDVNRQAWTASANLLVHPAQLYVGLKSEKLFVQRGESLDVDAIVTNIDGAAVTGRAFQVRAERLDRQQIEGEWKQVSADVQACSLTSANEAQRCTFVAREGGEWRVTAIVQDDAQRKNQTQIRLWVAGGELAPAREVTQEKVQLIPDRKEYRAGETAEVLVLAPFSPAEGIVTLRRSGLVRHERFRMQTSSHTLRIPVEEGWTPNLHLQVDLVGRAPRVRDDGSSDPALAPRPAFAAGSIDLPIPPYSRTLALKVTPRDKEIEPGGKTTLEIDLKDASGRPVANAELAVVVVDEAVLSLTGYSVPDPIATFYARREPGMQDVHSRASVMLARPDESNQGGPLLALAFDRGESSNGARVMMRKALSAPAQMEAAAAMEGSGPIRMRTDFSALALFAGSVPTDASGRAQVPVTVPDNLTRYRVMVVAVTKGNQFGKGESTLTARLPLMVRPSAPRFLNFGDRFELPVVVQNQTDDELKVDVAVRSSNAELTSGAGRRITVPARDRVEVRFPAAARRAGTARFQVGGVANRFADAAAVSLPVWTPATTEAFATYGQLDSGSLAQPITAPSDVMREFGGLEVTTSSTALQALTDAVLYLVAYPFECAEQASSRVLALAALKDVLSAFEAEGLPKPDEMVASVERDLKKLEILQNDDGGFAFWRRGDPSWPYISIHAAHALERAQTKGFSVPETMRQRSRAYLQRIERHIPKEYDAPVRQALRSYALYVLQRMGERDVDKARAILRETGVEKLPLEALGWLLPVVSGDPSAQVEVDAIRRQLANRATETAATASFAVDYGEQGPHLLLHSDRRSDAVLLEALIGDQPKSDLIPKLVEGLLAQRRKGRWESTQENAFVLLALDRYFTTYESVTPDFVARAWLGDGLAVEQSFRGRSTDRRHVEIPMRTVAELGSAPLVLAKDGPGRLYYRIGMRYAPASLQLDPADRGFVVERGYEALDAPTDVRRDADGTWRIRAGARVRVRLSMVAESRRYHVALVDPLPAGLEALNPTLATTGTLPDEGQTAGSAPGPGGPRGAGSWWWRRVWFDHQNLRDERVEAFSSLLGEGVYTYTYVARATTPGTFVVPPTKAEEMYHPETFGRSATDRVVVE